MEKLAIVGSGPMALYTLKHLQQSTDSLEITVYEASGSAGTGMPYRAGMNADTMLCNAFSREIPDVTQSLIDWLKGQPDRELSSWELSSHDLSARAFYPRVLIGEYLKSEFDGACEALRAAGHIVNVLTRHKVTDILPERQGFTVQFSADTGSGASRFDHVIIATGHVWPETPKLDDVELVSPWPYTNITELSPGDIGVLGSSLSAIDVVVALGFAHGTFEEDGGRVHWVPNEGAEGLNVRMVSHEGIMPEGDFYYPFPYEPLMHITDAAVQAEVAKGPEGLLERVFELVCKELDHSDPDYLREMGQDARTIPGFGEAYFARRQKLGGLEAVKRDLKETRRSMQAKETIPHRYALLRGHESFDHALRHLSKKDYATFQEHLMPVFADCYAAVPHLSLARIIALYDAGVLSLHATGAESTFRQLDDGRVEAETEDGLLQFDHLIDARGQASHSVADLPFRSLVGALENADESVDEPFHLELKEDSEGRVYCLAMPQILELFPFSQGLPGCDELAGTVVGDLLGSGSPGGQVKSPS